MTVAMYGTVTKLFGNTIVVGKDSLFVNNTDITGIKELDDVEYSKVGFNLETIRKVSSPAPVSTPAELRNGHGIIKVLDLNKPYLTYEFSWKDKQTGELKTAQQEFYQFTDTAKTKLSQFKAGDKIAVQFTGRGSSAVLHEIGADKPKAPWGGGGSRSDPTIDLIRNLSILNESILDKATDLVKFCKEQNMPDKQVEDMWALILKLTKSGVCDLYQEIEKKHKYQGGQ